jgi:hypothetical protein
MKKLPAALFVVDPRKEHIAVSEARTLKIPIVAIIDTTAIRTKSITRFRAMTTLSARSNLSPRRLPTP